MKKISIITIIDNNNFGTFLQAFALCKKLEDLGYTPELVDYCRPHQKALNAWWRMCKVVKNPIKILLRSLNFISSHRLHLKDRNFIHEYLSPKICHSVVDIQNSISPADVYMTGSDQVWNSIHNKGIDRAYYLDYAPEGAKKVSYAASVGMFCIDDNEKEEIKKLLESYSYITLRESSSIDLLEQTGVERNKLQTVLDPTLLLGPKEWSKYIKIPRLHQEKYLLVYSVETKEQDSVIDTVARKIAKEKNLKIVGVYYGNFYSRINCCDYNHFRATPDIFLSLMYNADFVVVSSFHGTAFAINFNKDFISVMPNRFNSRVANILHVTGLEHRLVKNESDFSNMKESNIDWTTVNKKIDQERTLSINILSQIIEK